jgi:hypothetical protein
MSEATLDPKANELAQRPGQPRTPLLQCLIVNAQALIVFAQRRIDGF